MLTYTAAFVLATALAVLLTPVVRKFALQVGAVSATGGRNINQVAVPRLGGVAIALAASVPVAVLFFVNSEVARLVRLHSNLAAGLAAGALSLCLCGAIDDVRALRARDKLIVQVASSTIAYFCGFQVTAVSLPFVGALDMGVFALPVTILWIVGVTNAVNLIDGLDGLAAGVVFCAAATNLIIAAISGAAFVAVVMAALMGALLGFLFYNFNPAKIFMGDSGSYFLGFVVATASLAGNQKASTAVSLLVPVLALGVPIFDTIFSIVRRAVEKRPIFSPDRGHVHHRLLDLGLTHRRAVLTLYFLSVLFALTALAVSLGRDWETGAALLGAVTLIAGLLWFVSNLKFRQGVVLGNSDVDLLANIGELVLSTTKKSQFEDVVKLIEEQGSQLVPLSLSLMRSGPGIQSELGPGEVIVMNRANTIALRVIFSSPYDQSPELRGALTTLVEVVGLLCDSEPARLNMGARASASR